MRLCQSMTLAVLCVVVWASCAGASGALVGEPALLAGLGIITGYDGGDLRLDQPLARAEFAVVAVRMRGMEAVARSARGFTRFSDVSPDHWAVGHIGIAIDHGMIAAASPESFRASDAVTWDEFLAGILVTCGYHERPPVDPYPEAQALGLVAGPINGLSTISRQDAFAVCARALIAPTGSFLNRTAARALRLIEILGAQPLPGRVFAHRSGVSWDEVSLESGGEQFTLRVSPAIDLSGRIGTDIAAWVVNGVIVAAAPADAGLTVGRLVRILPGREPQFELSEGQTLTVDEGTKAIINGTATPVAELARLPANSLIRAQVSAGRTVALWAQYPGAELVVVGVPPSGIRVLDEHKTVKLLSRSATILPLGSELWRGPLRPGTVLYELPGGRGYTAWDDQRAAVATGFDVERSVAELDGGPWKLGAAFLSGPDGWWTAKLTPRTVTDLLGRHVQISIDIDGRVRRMETVRAPSPGLAFVDAVTSASVSLVDVSGFGFDVIPAPGTAVARGGLVEFIPLPDGTATLRPVANSVTDAYFPVQHIDPDRMMIRDHEGVWRRLTTHTAVFFDEPSAVFPFHHGGVTVFGANMLRHFGFDDPAAGAGITAVLGPGPGGPVVEALIIRTPLSSAHWHSPAMTGVIVSVNPLSGIGDAIVLIEQSYVRVEIGDAVIRSRISTHGGQTSDRLSDLRPGEAARLQFNPMSGEIVSITEFRARPYTVEQPVFSVLAHDESIDSLLLVSKETGERMELLISSATVIYDGRACPRLTTAAQTVGCSVQIITESEPGLAGILVVVGP